MPKKFLGILVILAVLVLGAEIVYVSKQNQKPQVELEETSPILVWYTDPDIQTYMEETAAQAAAAYGSIAAATIAGSLLFGAVSTRLGVGRTLSLGVFFLVSGAMMAFMSLAGQRR